MKEVTGFDGDDNRNGSAGGTDFGFAFNDPKFSDKILRVEVFTDPSETKLGKRTWKEAEESQHPLAQHNEGSSSSSALSCRVTTVHISSVVLSAKSQFFYKMFCNGMRESEQQTVTLLVQASEELALLDLLQFLYNNKLQANTPTDLLKVLMLADKYQVVSCIRYCAQMLLSLPMTFELASTCVNLPSSVLAGDPLLPKLVNDATCFLLKNMIWHQEAALKLPLEIIQNILSWDKLEVRSEDDVYDFALKWARTHYNDLNERRQIFRSLLCQLIRFPYMSYEKLKTVLQCEELDQGDATKMVLEALFSKAQHDLPRVLATNHCPERVYKLRPVKVIVLDSPYQECIVYSELKKEECNTILGNFRPICTQMLHVGNECFHLVFQRNSPNTPSSNPLTMLLIRNSSRSTVDSVKVEWEIAVRSKITGKYGTMKIMPCILGKRGIAYSYIRDESWDSFISEQSRYFINGVFCLRVTLTLQQ